jgi:hypothetical protein
MRIESYLLAEMLQRMEQQTAVIRPYAVTIVTTLSREAYPAALEALAELHRALDAFVATTKLLQEHVVAHDGLGKMGESLGELTLRARAMVLRAQLDLVREALGEPAAHARAQAWFVGRVLGIGELVTFVLDRLTEIHAIWTPYRQNQRQPPGMMEADRENLYRTAIRVAQRALCELRDEPEVARFLDGGSMATDLPEVHLACKRIDTVLGLQFEVEPGRQASRKHRCARTSHHFTERP